MHWVCAGEHIENTGLYQNLGQQPNPNYGTVPGLHQQLLIQRLQRRVARTGRGLPVGQLRPAATAVFNVRTAPQRGSGTVREDLKFSLRLADPASEVGSD
jgi:hypothetical protein